MVRRKGQAKIQELAQRLEKLTIEYVPVTAIKPNAYNPNRQDAHEFELLCRSIREDGFTQPIIVRRDTGEIIDGEHRWRAAQHLGLPEVPVVYVDMTDAQMRIATLRHNRARGSEVVELSVEVLRDLERLGALEWAQESLMIDDDELTRLLTDISAPEALAAEEYSQAWVQVRTPKPTAAGAPEALIKGREVEEAVRAAKTLEEAEQAARESATHAFIHISVTTEERALLRRVLGEDIARRLILLCQAIEEGSIVPPWHGA